MSRNGFESMTGEAFGSVIAANATITELILSWNSIRDKGAVAIGESIMKNKTLKHLDLSNNSFRALGGNAIGLGVKFNTGLSHLDLSDNGLTAETAMVLASSMDSNHTLVSLHLSGNSIGDSGGRAIIQSMVGEKKRSLLVTRCTFEVESDDPTKLKFDPSSCEGDWELNLSKPYEYTIACKMLDTAMKGVTIGLQDISITERGKTRPIKLKRKTPSVDNDPYAIERGEFITQTGATFVIPTDGVLRLKVYVIMSNLFNLHCTSPS
jgi:hypothetical protein